MKVLHAHIPPHTHGDQGKRVTAIYLGSSGRRFKSCQPDQSSRRWRRFLRNRKPPFIPVRGMDGNADGNLLAFSSNDCPCGIPRSFGRLDWCDNDVGNTARQYQRRRTGTDTQAQLQQWSGYLR
jgi:hypothetical protein